MKKIVRERVPYEKVGTRFRDVPASNSLHAAAIEGCLTASGRLNDARWACSEM